MANRQYVGARYVPKFADPVEWNGALSYEALTIVTHLGNSFTSKKPVPANTDIGNTEYWVNTGNYNEQVASYSNEVKELNNEVTSNRTGAINVLQFNPQNYILDDALQAAIDACPRHGTVIIPFTGQSWRLNKTININKPLTITTTYYGWETAEDNNPSLIEYTGTDFAFAINSYGVKMSNMYVNTPNGSGVKIEFTTGITKNPRFTVFRDCWFVGNNKGQTVTNTYGILCNGAFKSVFENVCCYHYTEGFEFVGGTSITFLNCWARSCDRYGFYLENNSYSSFINCAADAIFDEATKTMSQAGYEIRSCYSIGLRNCGCENIYGYGIRLNSTTNTIIEGHFATNCNNSPTIYADTSDMMILGWYDSSVKPDNVKSITTVGSPKFVMIANTTETAISKQGQTVNIDNGFYCSAGSLTP